MEKEGRRGRRRRLRVTGKKGGKEDEERLKEGGWKKGMEEDEVVSTHLDEIKESKNELVVSDTNGRTRRWRKRRKEGGRSCERLKEGATRRDGEGQGGREGG